jgi:hypothetical protein
MSPGTAVQEAVGAVISRGTQLISARQPPGEHPVSEEQTLWCMSPSP